MSARHHGRGLGGGRPAFASRFGHHFAGHRGPGFGHQRGPGFRGRSPVHGCSFGFGQMHHRGHGGCSGHQARFGHSRGGWGTGHRFQASAPWGGHGRGGFGGGP